MGAGAGLEGQTDRFLHRHNAPSRHPSPDPTIPLMLRGVVWYSTPAGIYPLRPDKPAPEDPACITYAAPAPTGPGLSPAGSVQRENDRDDGFRPLTQGRQCAASYSVVTEIWSKQWRPSQVSPIECDLGTVRSITAPAFEFGCLPKHSLK